MDRLLLRSSDVSEARLVLTSHVLPCGKRDLVLHCLAIKLLIWTVVAAAAWGRSCRELIVALILTCFHPLWSALFTRCGSAMTIRDEPNIKSRCSLLHWKGPQCFPCLLLIFRFCVLFVSPFFGGLEFFTSSGQGPKKSDTSKFEKPKTWPTRGKQPKIYSCELSIFCPCKSPSVANHVHEQHVVQGLVQADDPQGDPNFRHEHGEH